MADVILYGPAYSAYTRTVRLTLAEKGVAYRLEEVDFAGGKGMPDDHLARQPFGKVPALAHGDFEIYETTAICRYIDAAFPGPALQPAEPRALGRMAQIVAILDAYLSYEIRMGMTSELLTGPLFGRSPDQARVERAKQVIVPGLAALEACLADAVFMCGEAVSLADLHAVPLFDYLLQCTGGGDLVSPHPRLSRWWGSIRDRDSVVATRPDLSRISRTPA